MFDVITDCVDIDKGKTISNIKKLLEKYHSIRRLAGSSLPNITATYFIEYEPETELALGLADDIIKRKQKANKLLTDIHTAFNSLSDEARKLIYLKYITENEHFDYEIFADLNISKDTYYRKMKRAQIEFAETFRGGALVITRDNKANKDKLKDILN